MLTDVRGLDPDEARSVMLDAALALLAAAVETRESAVGQPIPDPRDR